MKRNALASMVAAVAVVAVAGIAQADNWGDLSGQFIFEGDIPARVAIDTRGKDAEVCIPGKLFESDLVIDKKSKGIADIFVYMKKGAKVVVHPELKASKKKEVVFDQNGCQYVPHALFVRTDQVVLVKSADDKAHNIRTNTIRNQAANFIIPGISRKGTPVAVPLAESVPIPVGCDIHPWMKANWLILEHPYATVSAKDGKFKIAKLPEGEHEFRFWQERVGYLDVGGHKKGRLKVMIKKDGTKLPPIKLTIKKLTSDEE